MQGCQQMMGGMSCCAPKGGGSQPAQASQSKDVQRATVTIKDGYEPSAINVKAGKPVELTFLSKSESCANSVSILALDKTFTIENGGKTTITFTPKKGTTAFSCAMGMVRGQVIAR